MAEKLGVKSPSLYKHIGGLDELNKELMLYGWDLLGKEMMRAAVGKAKDDAVLDAYDLEEEKKVHIVRMFRGFLQGFSAIESHGGFGNTLSVEDTFDFSLEVILQGIHNLQGEDGK